MNISKINSTPSFKGYIEAPMEDEHGRYYSTKKIDADDITKITDGYGRCVISTRDKNYYYAYNASSLSSSLINLNHSTKLNTVLNAYMAAKIGGENFTVELW